MDNNKTNNTPIRRTEVHPEKMERKVKRNFQVFIILLHHQRKNNCL